MHADSPNGCWARHGYRVERYSGGRLRRIYDPSGVLVLDGVGYAAEIEYCRRHGLLTK